MSLDTYTKLLLHCDGSNLSTNIIDSSPQNYGAASVSGAYITTGTYEFGASPWYVGSLALSGGTYISYPHSADWEFGSGDFTIDFRRKCADTSYGAIMHHYQALGAPPWAGWIVLGSGPTNVWFNCGWPNLPTPGGYPYFTFNSQQSIAVGEWHHVALVKKGNEMKAFFNGLVSPTTADMTGVTVQSSSSALFIGQTYAAGYPYYFNGNLDEIRISKGIARWWV